VLREAVLMGLRASLPSARTYEPEIDEPFVCILLNMSALVL
jgi:hypothetical protein